MFKKILVTFMIVASFSLMSSAFAEVVEVTWRDSLNYDQKKFETWYAEPGNAKLWSTWYTQYHTEPEFVTFCKQTWTGTYCK
ncbi:MULTISPECIES: hypothetical protein [Legionella]|uniref:Uncharacterized protein n=1 Tax=Legionella resiliens TaxID=2905958 RepID=A0ABS8X772_9GAMM|nr:MULTISPECIES: hypothetical protein [unclassified Legionella]MCE0724598.1 hypothetical protein [Legionella sp. 9fVS26]MCE3533752.1 hypothetical protein [Legionella sp. 8cVS16]QLZ69948.1 hypothetical protein FOLKNPGA_02748 [Legionella sp. PC1000]